MTEVVSEPADEDLRAVVNRDAARLIRDLRCSSAPQSVLAEATAHIQQAIATLQPWLVEGQGWSTISIAGDTSGMPWSNEDITAVMPYSPVSGRHNAIAPPLRMWRDGAAVRGEVLFSPTYAGPPNAVHGGIIAAVFDEVLAMANLINGKAGFTGSLTIRYHRQTPLDTPIALWAESLRQEGRKQTCRGEMHAAGELTASAEGLFIGAPELARNKA